jgi:hypothetical protein
MAENTLCVAVEGSSEEKSTMGPYWLKGIGGPAQAKGGSRPKFNLLVVLVAAERAAAASWESVSIICLIELTNNN